MADIPQILNQPIFNAPPPLGGDSWAMPLVVAVIAAIAACFAAYIASWIAHSTQISKFRQAWINDLREDIADYIGMAEKWFRKYEEINNLPSADPEKHHKEQTELFPIANKARLLLRRVKMRFNPCDKRYHVQDDAFLKSLDDLLMPGEPSPQSRDKLWNDLANNAIAQAREILKREWEVTKKLPVPWRRRGDTGLQ